MNLRLIFCISLFTSILLTAQTIEIGRFFQDDNFSGSVTSAFIDLPTSPGNYTIEYTGLAGRGYSSHFFFDKGTYRSGYDGCYEIKINKLQIVPHDPEVGVPDDEYGDIREYVQSDPCSYHIDIRNSIVLNDYDLICIHVSCFPFFPWAYYCCHCGLTLNDNLQKVKVYYTITEGARLALDPYTGSMNIGTVTGLTEFYGQVHVQNNGNGGGPIIGGKITTSHPFYDLDLSTPYTYDSYKHFENDLWPGEHETLSFRGMSPKYAGPFVHTIIAGEGCCNYAGTKTFYIYGTVKVPDFCNQETAAKNLSMEENLFDSAFVNSSNYDTTKVNEYELKTTVKEKMKFAYDFLHIAYNGNNIKVKDVCKKIIKEYPNTEMGVSYFALDMLWQLMTTKDSTEEITKKDFVSSLEDIYKEKKYGINAWAGLILASFYEDNDKVELLDDIFNNFKNTRFGVISLYLKFMHYGIDKNDHVNGKKVLNTMDEFYPSSEYTYQAHLYLNENGYDEAGYLSLLDKNNSEIEKKINQNLNKDVSNNFDEIFEIPTKFTLYSNYPNPFNPSTNISFYMPKNNFVKVCVFNYLGQKIKELFIGNLGFGKHELTWNGTNESNQVVSSGIYLYTVEIDGKRYTEKMILQK